MKRTKIQTLLFTLALCAPLAAQNRLDPTLVAVLGGGLSAGYSGFRLVEQTQRQAWPSLVARQMGTILPLPTFRDDGAAGVINAFRPLPGLLPVVSQSGERGLPFPIFALNLSVPFLRVGESLTLRPHPQYDGPKLIAAIEGDLKTSLVNAILGGPLLTLTDPVLLSQTEYAEMLSPTMVFVELGFGDVLDAALQGNAPLITPASSFQTEYGEVIRRMAATHASVIALTVPDPLDAGYFATIDELAQKYGVAAEALRDRFHLASGDMLTLGGILEIGDALRGRRGSTLSQSSVVPAAVVTAIHAAVAAYNAAVQSAAGNAGVKVFDLGGFLHPLRSAALQAGHFTAGGGYGAGFYSEDGIYPSATGQALIANAVIQFLNAQFGASFAPIDSEAVAANDPAIVASHGAAR